MKGLFIKRRGAFAWITMILVLGAAQVEFAAGQEKNIDEIVLPVPGALDASAATDEASRLDFFRSLVASMDLTDPVTVEGLIGWADRLELAGSIADTLRAMNAGDGTPAELQAKLAGLLNVDAESSDALGGTAFAPGADTCGTAIALAFPFGDSTVTNDLATADADVSCNGGLANAPFGIWYTFTPGVNSILRVGETGTNQDIFWTVYSGGSCGTLVEHFCTGTDTNVLVAPVLTGGTQYWVLISKSNSTASTLRLAVNLDVRPDPATPPSNDACATATALGSVPATVSGSVFFSTDDADSTTTCAAVGGTGALNQSVWYSVAGTGNTMTATTCSTGTAFDTKLQVWTACGGAIANCIGGNDDQPGAFVAACSSTGSTTANRASTVTWCSEVGTTYLIAVGGFSAEVGSFVLNVTDGGPCHGACCIGPPFGCSQLTSSACTAAGGFYLGDGVPCLLDGYDACDCDDNGVLDRNERETIDKNFFFSFQPPLPIPDNNATGVIDVHTIEAECGLLFDVNIGLDITHPFDGDLDIFLLYEDMPNPPIIVELSTDNGGTGDNYTNTIFDSEAATSITAGAPPFTGTFRPEGSLAVLYNRNKCARWTLLVIDDASGDVGVVNGWSILFKNPTDDCNENLVPDKCEPTEACCLVDKTCEDSIAECCTDDGGTPEGPGTACSMELQACCLPDSTCMNLDPQCCLDNDGTPEGPGTTCTAPEACCLPDTSCTELDPLCCEDLGGTPEGPGSVCTELQACCLADGSCIDIDPLCCEDRGGTAEGAGTLCTPPQACCLPDGTCRDLDPLCCIDLNGTPEGSGTVCTVPQGCCLPDNTCRNLDPLCCVDLNGTPEGAATLCTVPLGCCLPDGTCQDLDPLCCLDLNGIPEGTACSGAQGCCLPDGTCRDLDPLCCINLNGTPEGLGSACSPPQACCLPNGTCQQLDPLCCQDIGGTSRGPGSTCDGIQACCLPNGTCSDIDGECCVAQGGTPRGPGSACDGVQACCLPNGTCSDIDGECCVAQGGTPRGPGSACDGVQACCLPNGTCSDIDGECCVAQGGTPRGPGSTCDGIQACCLPNGTCSQIDGECCVAQGGTPRGPGSTCDGVQACCLPNGTCSQIDGECCVAQGGTPRGPGSTCDGVQACCLPNGTCSQIDGECCLAQGGTPEGPGTQCTAPRSCCLPNGMCQQLDPECCLDGGGTPGPAGSQCGVAQACCIDITCVQTDPVCCAQQGGDPQGGGTACGGPGACVQPDDTCINVDEACCTGSGGDPEPGDCTEPHACCLPDGTCIVVDPVVCQRDGGDPQAELVCAGDANGNGIDDLCDQPGIPTVSEWGLLVLALLLLTGAKIGYSRNFLGATA